LILPKKKENGIEGQQQKYLGTISARLKIARNLMGKFKLSSSWMINQTRYIVITDSCKPITFKVDTHNLQFSSEGSLNQHLKLKHNEYYQQMTANMTTSL
jgi:hypothetical protein